MIGQRKHLEKTRRLIRAGIVRVHNSARRRSSTAPAPVAGVR
jgi:hypothetical protein